MSWSGPMKNDLTQFLDDREYGFAKKALKRSKGNKKKVCQDIQNTWWLSIDSKRAIQKRIKQGL